MPPKAKFTKNEIINAALEIVESEGWDALTARSLGKKLASSARPIFTVFNGMDEVQAGVVAAANAVYGGYVEEGIKKEIAFKGVGESYIKFATERPKLFQLLFMKERAENRGKDEILQGIEEHYEQIIRSVQDSYALDRETAKSLYLHMWIYTHGIAVLIATGVCELTAEQSSAMLSVVCGSLIKKIKTEGRL